jgi:hypothetical protein
LEIAHKWYQEAQFCADFKKVQNSWVKQKGKKYCTEKLIFKGLQQKKHFLGKNSFGSS